MAKFYNNRVKTGRLAGSVFAVRYGETIERAYQPVVTNPNTPAQIEVRAKMKLATQLASVVAPVIAIRRNGAQSARNLFIKTNYPSVVYSQGSADIPLLNIQLTKSVVALPSLSLTRSGEDVTARLSRPDRELDKVVYVTLVKESDQKLRMLDSIVVSEPGANADFQTSLRTTALEAVVLAYGIRLNTDSARVVFGDMIAPTAETVAKVITTSSLQESDLTVTETVGANYPSQS